MLRPGDARRRMERTLNAAYGDGLLSQQTLVQRLEVLFGSELVEPAGLVGDLTFRRPRRALSAARERVVAALSRAGARLLVGSDSPGAFSVPGFAYVEELRAFQRAGLAPAEILRAATVSAAEYFGAESTFGAVAEGMRADLVLLDGDPLADLDRVAHPAGVMVGGRWLSRDALEERLARYEHP
jgi:imidazolonepropionase-like amidohydrolase